MTIQANLSREEAVYVYKSQIYDTIREQARRLEAQLKDYTGALKLVQSQPLETP